jgi:hypothetical protein
MPDCLDDVQIAAPCPVKWESMTGDERVRHCAQCRLNVFNIAGMPRAEAIALVTKAQGRTCVRLFRRKDGTVLTADCPVGVRKLRRKVAMGLTGALALLVAGAGWASNAPAGTPCEAQQSSFGGRMQRAKASVRQYEPMKSLLDWIDPEPQFDDLTMTAGIMIAPSPVRKHR